MSATPPATPASPAAPASPAVAPEPPDEHRWLEEVLGERPLAWVRERNAGTAAALAPHGLAALEARLLAILDSDARIPRVTRRGRWLYNFWQDARNPRGLWRRTTLDEYRKARPAWETVLDVDALGAAEREQWTWEGAACLRPDFRRCLVSLSRGGSDAVVVREFDAEARRFVPGGFTLPEAKSQVAWIDADTITVGTDFGPGSMTTSGYPRVVKAWRRGTPLSAATTLYEGRPADVSVSAWRDDTPGFVRDFVSRGVTFYTSELFLRRAGGLVRVDKPDSAEAAAWRDLLLLTLRDDWTVGGRTYRAGSLLAAGFDAFLAGERRLDVLFEPTERRSLAGWAATRSHLYVNALDDVRSRVERLARDPAATPIGTWRREPVTGLPEVASVSVTAVDEVDSDDAWLTVDEFLTPTTLSLLSPGKPPERLKALPAFFDATGLVARQQFATSRDGTRVPYFEVARAGLPRDGTAPTLLNGYGGFEVSETPAYPAKIGAAWLERGGVYVLANIRGGGEYGPRWHQAALKERRPRSEEDFAAVAEDLIRRKVTSPAHLGILGGSNGGLLVGNAMAGRPELFGAVVCMVPLLDMRRYTRLLAGASWMGEYGDPDEPEEWAFIRGFSPYHRLAAGVRYPPTLLLTSTRDDRVHPGHARKFGARLRALGQDVLYYENIEGGHGAAATNAQAARLWALSYAFLWSRLR
jgi:prolyl oligopeptidase